jgi:hypothetical protein
MHDVGCTTAISRQLSKVQWMAYTRAVPGGVPLNRLPSAGLDKSIRVVKEKEAVPSDCFMFSAV